MPRITRINSSRGNVGGSLGRQRIDAPVEAFGTGRGLQQVGRGIQATGQSIERIEKEREAEAKKKQDEMSRLKRERAMLNYSKKMNFYLAENKDRQDYEKNIQDYHKFSREARDVLMQEAGVVDPVDVEKLAIEADRSQMGYDLAIGNRALEIQKTQERTIRRTRLQEETVKLLDSTDELERNPDLGDWMETYGAGWYDAVNAIANEVGDDEELKSEVRKGEMRKLSGQVIQTMVDKMMSHPEPEIYNKLIKHQAKVFKAANIGIDKQAYNDMVSLSDKAYAARKDRDIKARRKQVDDIVNSSIADVQSAKSSIDERKYALEVARINKKNLATDLDPTGNENFQKIQNAYNTIYSRAQADNAAAVRLTLIDKGPDAAMKLIETLEKGRVIKDKDGKVVVNPETGTPYAVSGISDSQSSTLRGEVTRKMHKEVEGAVKLGLERLKALHKAGKLYSFQHESGVDSGARRDINALTFGLTEKAAKLLSDQDFEELKLEVGESASMFDKIVPYASDWDQHVVTEEQLDNIGTYIMNLALRENIRDPEVINQKIKEILIPIEKSAAMKTLDARVRLSSAELKKQTLESLEAIQ